MSKPDDNGNGSIVRFLINEVIVGAFIGFIFGGIGGFIVGGIGGENLGIIVLGGILGVIVGSIGGGILGVIVGKWEAGFRQRMVMGLAGSMLLIGGILFDSALDTTRSISNFYWESWQGLSGWSAVLIIAGIGYGIATVVPPKGVLRRVLVAAGILVILLVPLGLSPFFFVMAVCACD